MEVERTICTAVELVDHGLALLDRLGLEQSRAFV